MNIAPFIVPFARLSPLEDGWRGPIAFVELGAASSISVPLRLPACPIVGIGAQDHPLADIVDVVAETPAAAAQIAGNVQAHPLAAAALVQVLRSTSRLDVEEALTVESMSYAMLQGSAEHRDWLARRTPEASMPPGGVTLDRHGTTLHVTLNRPEAGNAIDRGMRDELASALTLASLDPEIAQVVLQARGKAFSLGADLDEFGTTTDPATAHAIRGATLPARAAFGCAGKLYAHIDGACVGAGLELAACAGRITATPRSWFQLPELAMGIIPGAGGCVSLPRRIGRRRTALMVLSGRRVGAREALSWGLIDALVDDASAYESGSDIG